MDSPFVTIMLADFADSLRAAHDDEQAAAIRRERFDAIKETMAAHDGRKVTLGADGVIAAFASAVAAVRCAVDIQRASGEAGIRIGIDAGEPPESAGEPFGACLVVAERLCSAAEAGQILVSEVVRAIAAPRLEETFSPAGAVRVPGIAEPVGTAAVQWDRSTDLATTRRKITVLIADDQELVRAGFAVIVDAEPDLRVVAEARDGAEAVALCERHRPDVVLMDIRMPELDGLEAAERLLRNGEAAPKVVMLTTFDADDYVFRALRIGASGFLLKDAPANRLLDAIRSAAAGDSLIEPSITRRLVERFAASEPLPPADRPRELETLTERELEVLRLIARGLSNAEIAERLVVAESTVKTHVARLLMKLGLRDRVQAVVYAYEHGLTAGDD